jgi:hypothetical protein
MTTGSRLDRLEREVAALDLYMEELRRVAGGYEELRRLVGALEARADLLAPGDAVEPVERRAPQRAAAEQRRKGAA